MRAMLLRVVAPIAMWRRAVTAVLLGLAALVPASIAWAHGADMKAFLTLDPPVPSPAQHALRLELLDFYDNKVPGAKMLVSVEARSRAAQAAELREIAPGTYQGDLRFPTADEATLRVEANLPGGPWSGERRIRIGDRARSLQNAGLAMRHWDDKPIRPLGLMVLVVMLLVTLGGVVWGVQEFRGMRRERRRSANQ